VTTKALISVINKVFWTSYTLPVTPARGEFLRNAWTRATITQKMLNSEMSIFIRQWQKIQYDTMK